MANIKNVRKVNLEDFEQPKDKATLQRSNAATHVVDNTVTIQQRNAKKKKTVPRTNGCTYYIEDKHNEAIDRIKCFNKIDKQDVVRTALDMFLKKYMKEDGMGLTEDGVGEIDKYNSED